MAVVVVIGVDPGEFLPGAPHAVALAEHINNIAGWSFILFGITFVLFGVVRATGAVLPPLMILIISLLGIRIGFANEIPFAYPGEDGTPKGFVNAAVIGVLMMALFAFFYWFQR